MSNFKSFRNKFEPYQITNNMQLINKQLKVVEKIIEKIAVIRATIKPSFDIPWINTSVAIIEKIIFSVKNRKALRIKDFIANDI
ncbi:hypothetical protein [Aquirufa regiilacus]|uniref:Uncharacterized protein n=1 Tax=Aquirufa regiilacus TaxID=3024868 RepID=A0ABU3TPL9_9BACT|nr:MULTISPECIES: hypothetical protein [unclassified Aquirufa]MDT8886914.1 hypothetical protein [Aquirufa sp. LEPPI-3A]MDU0807809.1 hypothetical protein [Aquirufa sp. LEOWEIH-7C]